MTELVKKKVELPASAIKYVKYSECKPGDTLVVGKYLESKMVPNFNKDGEVPLHLFEDFYTKGTLALNSSAELNRILENKHFDTSKFADVKVGSWYEITYLGKEKGKTKDGKSYMSHTFQVDPLEDPADEVA